MHVSFLTFFLGLFVSSSLLRAENYNKAIYETCLKFPKGGGYSVKKPAFEGLLKAVAHDGKTLKISPQVAQPSFCSAATYLVFLDVVQQYQAKGHLTLNQKELEALSYHEEADGVGFWGRWNSNGPGVAKIVKDLKIGVNFDNMEKAQPGDFMKLFWNEHIGKQEFGHLVIYLYHDAETVSFWSSNQPDGYGIKTIPRSKAHWAIFSRITTLKNLSKVDTLPEFDPFLVGMLNMDFTQDEVRRACEMQR